MSRRWFVFAGCLIAAAVCASPVFSATVNHGPWDELTEKHVSGGRVDYAGVARDRQLLSAYLVSIREADPSRWSKTEQLAFWINAYNACIFKGVLDYPGIRSVKDVKGFFNRITYRVAGRDLTLDEIEQAARALGDWRSHFAVASAAAGCPPIRPEAYQAEWLDAQLNEQVRDFMTNRKDGIRVEGNSLWVSSIFKWYAKDFVDGKMVPGRLLPLLQPYLPSDIAQATANKPLTLKFLNYDWSLNSKPQGG